MFTVKKPSLKKLRLPVIIDCRLRQSEVDDLNAIVRAIAEPKFNILGINCQHSFIPTIGHRIVRFMKAKELMKNTSV